MAKKISRLFKILSSLILFYSISFHTYNKKEPEEIFEFRLPPQDEISISENTINLGPKPYEIANIKLRYFETLKTLNLDNILEQGDFLDKQFIINGPWQTNISKNQEYPGINLEKKTINTLKANKIDLEKRLGFFHYWQDEKGRVRFEKSDEDSSLIAYLENAAITNGPFTIYQERDNDHLSVRTSYGYFDAIPMKIILEKQGACLDTIETINEKDYPPYFVSYRLKNKENIGEKDIMWMLKAYENQKGDYFDLNDYDLVCSDIIGQILKTIGINYRGILKKNKISNIRYSQRNMSNFINLIEKEGLEENMHYYLENNDRDIFNIGGWVNLTPINFNIENFNLGQIVIFTRYFASGPDTGQTQRRNVHVGMISGLRDKMIDRVAMITSTSNIAPYTEQIKLYHGHDFQYWYDHLRSTYLGSDETSEALTYRVRMIIDFPEVLTYLKNKYGETGSKFK
jgi:hypothetical protein